MKKTSIVRINFEENQVLAITKDAKITIPDMVGNIGGTLGVFIGFSFLGVLDVLVEYLQYIMKWRATHNKTQKARVKRRPIYSKNF